MERTIAAISTPQGNGGIAVIRISGNDAVKVADKVFFGSKRLADCDTHTVHYGFIKNEKGEKVDEVLATVMLAPKTFTREDVVEISTHGGSTASRAVLDTIIRAGAYMAEPGEFTKRAFLNGKMDLVQADAVMDLINAETRRGASAALEQLEGGLSRRIGAIEEKLLDFASELAAAMDAKGYQFSSANSINIGRLVPQVVYYVYAYTRLLGAGTVAEGEPVNFVVPTGNFGNILAAFYAKNMGIPVGKLICASNENKVLYDFFDTGVYDRNREFVLTSSPSMDILISSNLERLIYRIAGEDAAKTKEMMDALSADGKYTLTEEMKAQLADFVGGWASEEKTAAEIKRVYDATGYVMDTHTAVASAVYKEYKDRTGDETKTVIASTASPYKFATSVMTAIDAKYEGMDDFALIDELSKVSGVSIPQAVEEIRSAPVLHDTVCETADMQKTVETILGL